MGIQTGGKVGKRGKKGERGGKKGGKGGKKGGNLRENSGRKTLSWNPLPAGVPALVTLASRCTEPGRGKVTLGGSTEGDCTGCTFSPGTECPFSPLSLPLGSPNGEAAEVAPRGGF